MKQHILPLFLSILMLMMLTLPTTVSAVEQDTYTFPITGTDSTAVFDPQCFAHSAKYYNHDLALLSLGLLHVGWSNDTAVIGDLYASLGFTNAVYYNYDKPLTDHTDKIAFSIAQKEITVGTSLFQRDTYTLITIVTRGGNYGSEWVSNFHVGSGATHVGFDTAAQETFDAFTAYCAAQNIDLADNVKILITGYSRSAAVSNLAAEKINRVMEAAGNTIDHVYAYTFATPNTVIVPAGSDTISENNENIINIVSADDLVTAVPLPQWNYGKYGVNFCLPETRSATGAALVAALLHAIVPTTADYTAEYQALFMDLMRGTVSTDEITPYATVAMLRWAELNLNNPTLQSYVAILLHQMQSQLTPSPLGNLMSALTDAFLLLDADKQDALMIYLTGMDMTTLMNTMISVYTTGAKMPALFFGEAISNAHMPQTYLALLDGSDPAVLFGTQYIAPPQTASAGILVWFFSVLSKLL